MKKNKTNKFVVNVTQKHIDEGIPNINTGDKCIIALALKDKFPVNKIEVHYDFVKISGQYYDYSQQMKDNQLSIIDFNSHNPQELKAKIKPFKFYLTKN